MKMLPLRLLILAMPALTSNAWATCTAFPSAGSSDCIGKVTVLYVDRVNDVIFTQNATGHSSVTCTLISGTYWRLSRSNAANFDELYSVLMLSSATGRSIRVVSENNNIGTECVIDRIELLTP